MSIAGLINILDADDRGGRLPPGPRSDPESRASVSRPGARLGHGADIFFGLGLLAPGCRPRQSAPCPGRWSCRVHPPPNPALPAAGDHDAPALIVIAVGLDPSRSWCSARWCVIWNPFALIPLLLFCRDKG